MFIHVKVPDCIPMKDGKMENIDAIVQAVDPEDQILVKCRQKCAIKDPDLQKKLCANVFLDGALGLLEAWGMDKELQDFVAELTPDDINAIMDAWKSYLDVYTTLRAFDCFTDDEIISILCRVANDMTTKAQTNYKRKEDKKEQPFKREEVKKESYMNKPDDPLRRFLVREVYRK